MHSRIWHLDLHTHKWGKIMNPSLLSLMHRVNSKKFLQQFKNNQPLRVMIWLLIMEDRLNKSPANFRILVLKLVISIQNIKKWEVTHTLSKYFDVDSSLAGWILEFLSNRNQRVRVYPTTRGVHWCWKLLKSQQITAWCEFNFQELPVLSVSQSISWTTCSF